MIILSLYLRSTVGMMCLTPHCIEHHQRQRVGPLICLGFGRPLCYQCVFPCLKAGANIKLSTGAAAKFCSCTCIYQQELT